VVVVKERVVASRGAEVMFSTKGVVAGMLPEVVEPAPDPLDPPDAPDAPLTPPPLAAASAAE
jgi:hypothetical protein